MFLPIGLIDGRHKDSSSIIDSVKSLLSQTISFPKIDIIIDSKTNISNNVFTSILTAKEGGIVNFILDMGDKEYDHVLINTIKNYKRILGTHKLSNRPKMFNITHAILLYGGQKFKSKDVLSRLIQEWEHGIHYDLMFLGNYNPSPKTPCVFYVSAVRCLCTNNLFQPFIEKQEIFDNANIQNKNFDFIPIRTCRYGVISIS